MARDLKLELRKILALHEASLRMEHAIRESARPDDQWRDFTPSRFIYAFFTFNTIYSWDWQASFESGHPERWQQKANGRYPDEIKQIKGFVRFCSDTLEGNVVEYFRKRFVGACNTMGAREPADAMVDLDITNADKKLKKLKDQMPQLVKRLLAGAGKPDGFHSDACHVLRFVYGVRCNLFHGCKTHVQMHDAKQQKRLLVYASLLTAANGLLFDATSQKDIGFRPVSIDFLRGAEPTDGSMVPGGACGCTSPVP